MINPIVEKLTFHLVYFLPKYFIGKKQGAPSNPMQLIPNQSSSFRSRRTHMEKQNDKVTTWNLLFNRLLKYQICKSPFFCYSTFYRFNATFVQHLHFSPCVASISSKSVPQDFGKGHSKIKLYIFFLFVAPN